MDAAILLYRAADLCYIFLMEICLERTIEG